MKSVSLWEIPRSSTFHPKYVYMSRVDSFGMTPSLRRIGGKEAAAIQVNIDFTTKMIIESPLLPSPYTVKKRVIPNESTLDTIRKPWI